MTLIEEAVVEAAGILDELRIPYVLIGGLAVAFWGEPRATLDVDLSLWVGEHELENTVAVLATRFLVAAARPLDMVKTSRVLRAVASNGVALDLLFGRWPMEYDAIQHAATKDIEGRTVRLASLEYLIFLKVVSDRPKDLADARALLKRYRKKMDLINWLEQQLSSLADSIGQSDILDRFHQFL